MNTDKRLIEESFPVKEVGIESSREKTLRDGYISTLHIWWSRKPLASSRATIYASLVSAPKDDEEWEKKRNFIVELSKWSNSNNHSIIEKAQADILKSNNGIQPKILDPFAGGGSIPLEALRLGCETYSSDYNPVAVLIQKCTIEYPQKYGHYSMNQEKWGELSRPLNNPLLEDVKKWGRWVFDEVRREIGQFYPSESDGSIPVGYYWLKTIPCQNPSCGSDIPLTANYWLSKKEKGNVIFFPYNENGKIQFKIAGDGYDKIPEDFNPDDGNISRAVSTCLCCGSTIDANTTRHLFSEGKSGQRMIVVILKKPGQAGKKFRIATNKDFEIFKKSENYLKQKENELRKCLAMEPIPDEPLPAKGTHRSVGSQLPLYNFKTWGDLFNSRQKLALITFIEKVRATRDEMIEQNYDELYLKAIQCYLALGIDRIADYGSTLCLWNYTGGRGVKGTFARQALQMVWNYSESNPFNPDAAGWPTSCEKNEKWIEHASLVSKTNANIFQASAVNIPEKDNSFDAIITDPPYYDNIPYSYLSDFFYVWLKRSIGDLFPELFATHSTPKKNEIVVYDNVPGGKSAAKALFENNLKKSFVEMHRLLKPQGIAVIVYAHKSTEGWETLINSLLDSGLIVTSAWPLNTEMGGRMNAMETASLASSIYIVARKMERQPTGFYNNVKEELKTHLNKKLDRLWNEGISGADFFIAAIGSAIEVFGKYEQVMDYEGNVVRADRLLLDVRKIATDYAVRQILHNGFAGEISDMVRLYVLWRWNYSEAKVPFDEARKLGQSCGIDISHEWSHTGFIKKDKEFVRLLGPQERKLEDLEGSKDMIDVLHQVLLLWEKSRRDEMIKVLQVTGYGKSEAFYRVAQAISESLPNESKEKKLLEGFTAGRERMTEEVKKEARQARLDL